MRGSKGRIGEVPGASTRRIGQPTGAVGPKPIAAAVALALLALNGWHSQSAHAAPTGEQLVGGAASVLRPNAQTTIIDQSSQRAALNWTSFGIAAGESVIFRQPSASAVALNRVTGSEASHIYGSLQANGQVFLVNPNGVTFARGASVDVGGLVASTLGITNNDFMAGRYVFSGGSNAGAIENHTNIRAANGGYVAFLGNQVTNTGAITANRGTVAFGAGDTMQLDFHGDGLLTLKVDAAAANAKLANSGVITADGGQVFLTARAKNALLSTAINMDGVITAKGLTERNGKIVLDGGRSGVTNVSGTLDASSANAGQKGGEIRVLGEYVGLFGNAKLDASGAGGGGTALVGGDFQGKNPQVQNAVRTYVGPDATIKADAITNGDGGKVIVWADDTTKFYGTISARGGAESGNGGFVEVSGKQYLAFAGQVDTRAPRGRIGTLLLDPFDIDISSAADADIVNTAGTFDDDPAQDLAPSILNVTTLETALAGGNVIITTSSGADAGNPGQAGNIRVLNPVTWATANSLTLTADNSISLQASITGTSGALNLNAGAGGIAQSAGTISVAALTATTTGGIAQTGGDMVVSGTSSFSAGAAAISLISASNNFGGAVTLSNSGANNVSVTNSTAIELGTVSVGQNLAVTANGSITDTGNITVPGTTTLTAGAANDIILNNANDFGGAVSVVSGNNVTLNDASTIDLGASTVSGNLAVTSAGNITDSGNLSVTGTTTLAPGAANSVILDQAGNNFVGAFSVTNGTNVTVVDANALSLGPVTITGDLAATATAGDITNTGGALTIGGNSTFTADAAGASISVDNAANNFTGTVAFAGAGGLANVSVVDTTALDLQGLTLSGNLNVTAAGITDSAAIAVTGATSLTAGAANNITLDSTNDFVGAVSVVSANNVTLADVNAIVLGASTVSGALAVTVAGTITQMGALSVTGVTSLTAGAVNDITLNLGNDFSGAVSVVSGNNVTLNDVNAIVLGGSTISGALMVTAAGAITQAGALSVAAGTSLSAGAANDITLNAPNDFTGAVSVVSGNNVTLNDINAIDLGASTISGNFVVTATGAITDSGALGVTGTTTLTAGAASVTLDNANDFTGAVSVNNSGANAVQLNDVNALQMGASAVGGDLTVTSGGTLAIDGAVGAAGAGAVTLTAAGAASDVVINATLSSGSGPLNLNAGRNVALNAGSLSTTGNVTLNAAQTAATGAITESGAGTIAGALLTTNSKGGTVLNTGNAVSSFNATNTTGGNVALTNTAAALSVTGINQTGGGNVVVTNTGNLTVAGDVTAAAGTVMLTAAGANSLLTNSANIASTTNVELNADQMALGGSIASTAGGVGKVPMITLAPVTAGRAISIGGADDAATLGLTQAELNTARATTLRVGTVDAGAITIDSNVVLSAFDNLHLRTGSTISGVTSSLGVSGLLLEAASANISNPSNDIITLAGRISGAGSPFTYAGDGNGVIIGTIAGVSGIMTNNGNVNVTTTGAITLNAPIVAGTATVALQGSAITSDFTTGFVTAGALRTVSTTGSTSLQSNSNNVGTFAGQALAAGASLTYSDADTLEVGSVAGLNGATTNNGLLSLTAGVGGNLSIAQSLSSGTAETLLIASRAITQNAGATLTAGQLSVFADNATLASAGNSIGTLSALTFGTGQTLTVRDSDGFTAGITDSFAPFSQPPFRRSIGATGNVTLIADTGTITLAAPIVIGSNTLTLNATSGSIVQNSAAEITATTLLGTAGTSAELGGSNVLANLGAFTTNGAFTLNNAGALNVTGPVTTQNGGLASITTGGTLAVTTGSVAGAGVALTTTGGADITLNGAVNGNAGTVALNSAGLITQTATGLINTTGALTGSAATAVVLDQANTVGALGPFTNSIGFTFNDATGGLTLTGMVDAALGPVSITTAGGPLALQSNFVHGAGGVTLQGVGVTSTAGSVISSSGQGSFGMPAGAVQVTATGTGAIALGGSINASGEPGSAGGGAGGNVTLTTANGPITVAVVNAAGGNGAGGNANGGDAGTIVFNVGGANTLTLNGDVTSRGGDAAGSGNAGSGRSLTIAAPTLIGGDVTIATGRGTGAGAASGGSVAFASTVDADAAAMNRKLSIAALGGAVTFSGNVGASQALADLDVTASSIVFNSGGAQSVNVSAQGGNTATFAGPVTLAQNLTFNTTGSGDNNIAFSNAVNADAFANNRTLTVATGTGSATFGDGIGIAQELGALTVSGNQLVMSGDIRVNGGGAIDFTNLANMSFTSGATIDTDRVGGATGAGNILFAATTRANPTAADATWTLDATADGAAAAGNVRLGTIGNVTGLNVLNVTGDRVTFAGPVSARQVFVTANRVETTGDGRIFASRGFTGVSETDAALSLRALTGEGSFGDRNAPIQIAAPGLFVVVPNSSNALSPVFLAGDPNLRPVYQFAEDPSGRLVFYNGAAPDSPANRAAQSAITQQLRQLLDEINQAGFSKENIRRQLLQGVILETGLSRPGIDDFIGEGVTAPPSCNAVVTAGGKIDCP